MITARTLGTVVEHDEMGHTYVAFDKVEGSTAWWQQGTTEQLAYIPNVKVGDRVILEYHRTAGSGLWYGRKMQ